MALIIQESGRKLVSGKMNEISRRMASLIMDSNNGGEHFTVPAPKTMVLLVRKKG